MEERAMGYEEALRRIEEVKKTGATGLYLFDQGLTELPLGLFQLKQLTQLDLSSNNLTELPPAIIQLTNLTRLNLSDNNLTGLPSVIEQLTSLTTLILGGNNLTKLPSVVGRLTNLSRLEAWDCNLKYLPYELFELNNLIELHLDNNQLTHLPHQVKQLINLSQLELNYNELTFLPPEIVELPNLEELNLFDNPLVSPPLEIALQGMDAIRSYFASLEGESRLLAEVKVILVGEGASGKTSLTRCLRGEPFNAKEETTHGIRIKKWEINGGARPIRCNLWDFGGQEIMHATHQFFLSRRSLYVLVLDGRRDEQPEYWLRYIESFGGGSPVLVVLNKQDTNPSFDVDRIALRRKFPFIKGFWQTSCCTGQGVEAFQEALHQELGKVPFIETRWANAWFSVKEELEQMNTPCISYDEFEATCRDAGVEEKISRETLLAFLHDLGIVIHFTEFELEENHVLDPKWVTEGVYAIINAPSLAASRGLLRLRDLREIFRCAKDCCYQYGHEDYRYLIGLMKKFELCYELDDERVLIPQLFGVQEPAFAFDDQDALRFELRYEDFLPASVMPRFIVNRHQEIQGDLRWRNGVVLEHPLLKAGAVVRVDNETRRIHITVTGRERKVFLALIWLTLREINADFAGLKVSERVPLPDQPTISVDYQTLLNNLEQGVERFVPEGTNKAYSVKDLLAGVHFDDPAQAEQMMALADGERKGGLMNRVATGLNTAVKLEPSVFGVGINLNAVFDYLLGREKKKPRS
jgi:small GTP-binding protein